MSDDSAFDAAVEILLAHEGGLADDPADPGGITNFGISLRSYPELGGAGIRALTPEQAKAIYRHDWWLRYGWNDLAPPLDAKLLDIGVNIGADAVHRALQRALRANGVPVAEDGALGPATRSAIAQAEPKALLAAFRSEVAGHYRLIAALHPAEQRFLQGWLARAYG